MTVKNFIPTLWSARLKEQNKQAFVFAQSAIINRDYQGEITGAGDTVKINTFGEVIVSDYTRGNLGAPQELTSTQQTLVIDQEKAFNFAVEDIDIAQANVSIIDKATGKASEKLTEIADKFIAGLYTGAGITVGTDAAPIELTKANVFEYVVQLGVDLDKKNVPRANRFLIVDPEFYGLLVKSDVLHKANAQETILNGQVGNVGGFTVFLSNNAPKVTAGGSAVANTKAIAGHPSAWTFAEQIVKVVGYEPEGSFSQAVKGLHVYGGKVLDPNSLAVLSYKI